MSKSKTNNQGITIIEVLVTITVVVVGLMAIVQTFPVAFKLSRTSEQATIATNLAQAKIEEMFYLDYDNIPIGVAEARHRLSSNPDNQFYQYQRETSVEYVDGDLNPSMSETGIKKVTVTTYWNSVIFSMEKSISIIILISEK
ncbi:MAG TPA: hypothetical protein VJB67_00425 [Patescibacteria group bacterium]|nr:hypothetical protein [Patescibacteria group bacterium]